MERLVQTGPESGRELSGNPRDWQVRRALLLSGFLFLLMLVYASLVPLQYRPLDWHETLERWKSIPWLQLGVYNRADWIANGLVVVPVAFLLTGALCYRNSPRRAIDWLKDLGATTLVVAFLVAVVLGIEMVQVWFPPRTVSGNDIVAGWIGAVIGAVAWLVGGAKGIEATSRFFGIQRLEDRLVAFAIAASIAAFLYSIYPLDLILNSGEWAEKIRLGRVQWGLLPQTISTMEWLQGLLVSAIRLIPFGVLTLRFRSVGLIWAWILGTGLFLELVQLPFFTKYTTFGDVLAGWIGGAFGAWVSRPNRLWDWLGRTRWLWIGATALWSCILLAAFLARSERWVFDPAEVKLRWSGFFTFPLLRYYYTSEYRALTNLLGKVLSFNVLGALVGCSVMFGRRTGVGVLQYSGRLLQRQAIRWAILLAVPIGLTIETLQIYRFDLIGDLSDVGIYALGAGIGAWLTVFIVRGPLSKNEQTEPNLSNGLRISKEPSKATQLTDVCPLPAEVGSIARPIAPIAPIAIAMGMILLGFGCWLAGLHPGWPVLQILCVLGVFGLTSKLPSLFPMVFILLLVAADAYPWTGQLALQEYDSLLLGAFAGLCFSSSRNTDFRPAIRQRIEKEPLLFFGFGLLAISMVISILVGLVRLPTAPWGDQLSVYFTRWNTIRVAKGILWGLAFAIWMFFGGNRSTHGGARTDGSDVFLVGCTWAGLYVGLFVALERAIFPGLLNWSDVYRATGPFFTMHIGDQHLDAFLVMFFPLVWASALRRTSSLAQRLLCVLVLGLMAYGAFSTLSRATLATILLQVIALLCVTWKILGSPWGRPECMSNKNTCTSGKRASLATIALGLLIFVSLILAARTEAFQSRFSTNLKDWNGRVSHWSMILKRGTTGIGGTLIGHGIGTLPSLVAFEFDRPIPPLKWDTRLEAGVCYGEILVRGDWPIYLERIVSRDSKESLQRLEVDFKLLDECDRLNITASMVEKSILESFDSMVLSSVEVGRSWERIGGGFDEAKWQSEVGGSFGSHWRPWSIGLSAQGKGAVVIRDTNSISIGQSSSYPWFFTCDDHMVWRAKNFLVHAYYEQGLAGAAGWVILVYVALRRGFKGRSKTSSGLRTSSEWPLAFFQGVSILGFVGVGFFGTLIDTPWITALLLAILSIRQGVELENSIQMETL